MPSPFYFDRSKLLELAAANRQQYQAARPFAHIVLDDFMPEWVLDGVLAEFPSTEQAGWMRFESENERKLGSTDETEIGDATRHLLTEFNSAPFIDFLQELTGIGGLVPDPHFEGGGLHQILSGGHLSVHVDFNRHPGTGLDRRLNTLLYLNRDWQSEWEGSLELWSRDMKRCEERIEPLFNRLVVFSTTEHSFHGHPTPLACPEGLTRRSLALYYYSNGRPEEDGAAAPTHSTIWGHEYDPQSAARERVSGTLRRLTPPIVLDAVRAARRRDQP